MQKQLYEGLFKKGVVRNFAEFTRKTLVQMFSCEFCKIHKNTFFAEHHLLTVSDYGSINKREGRIGKRNGKL